MQLRVSLSHFAGFPFIFRQIALMAGSTACAHTQKKNDMAAPNDWTPSSWKSKPIVQDVVYEDQDHVDRVLNKLNRLPPMVSPQEVCVCGLQGVSSVNCSFIPCYRSRSYVNSLRMWHWARRSSYKVATVQNFLIIALR